MRERARTLIRRGRSLVGRLEAKRLATLAVLLLVVGALWAFLAIAEEMAEGELAHLDERILIAFRRTDDPSVPIGPGWLLETARDLTALGGVSVLACVIAAVLGYLVLARQRRAAIHVFVATIGGTAISFVLKELFARPRPTVVPQLDEVATASFPSGHAMLSAIVYLTLGTLLVRLLKRRRLQAYVLGLAMAATVIVGLTRVYLGVHYPSDVLAGWAAGLAWAFGCDLVVAWVERRRREKRGDERDVPRGGPMVPV